MREMKDSGIEWIGEIPADWELSKIGAVYEERNEKVSDADFPPLSVTKQGVVPQLETAAKTNDGDNRKLIRKNDFVINSRSDRRGSCGISEYDGSCSLINTVLKPRRNMCNAYYSFVFRSERFADEFYRWGNGIVDDLWSTKWSNMKRIYIPAPSLQEQRRIADYLDRKCSQIDAIIARQQEVIEKLKAYKLSIITEAVTKGLNPDVPMKDSGVEWIGEIPDHWRLIKLKNIVGISDGTHDTPAYVDISETSHPLVTSKCIVNGKIDPSLGNHISQDDYDEINKRSKVHLYDVIMPMIGTVGNPALVLEEPNFAIKNVALLKTRGSLELGKFVLYLLSSNLATVQFDKINRGGVQSFISQEKLKNMIFTLPDSMSEIVVFLDKKIAAIDNVIKQKQMLIDKLVDWKKSLIYEVVTGKKEVKV